MIAKKPHPSEIRDREQIALATEFSIHLRRGPEFAIREDGYASLKIADARAQQIEAVHVGKQCLIYAVSPDGRSYFVPADMRLAARNRED